MKIRVAELEGAKLDMWAAKALGWKQAVYGDRFVWVQANGEGRFRCNFNEWNPSLDWAVGGPIIERERIDTTWSGAWFAVHNAAGTDERQRKEFTGPAALIAAMRAFVYSKFGEEVEE